MMIYCGVQRLPEGFIVEGGGWGVVKVHVHSHIHIRPKAGERFRLDGYGTRKVVASVRAEVLWDGRWGNLRNGYVLRLQRCDNVQWVLPLGRCHTCCIVFLFPCCSRIERRRWRGRYIVVYLGRRPLSLLNDVSLQRQRPCDAVELEEEAASIAQGKTLGVLPPQRSGGGCAVGAFYIRIGWGVRRRSSRRLHRSGRLDLL